MAARMLDLDHFLQREQQATFAVYREQPRRLVEDGRRELEVLAGGYSRRQLLELLQNAFDAVGAGDRKEGRVAVRIAGERLYTANDGRPFDRAGYESLLASDLSAKRGEEIGRFGLGFKSLIRIGREIDVFGPAGGLRFEPARCRRELWRLWQSLKAGTDPDDAFTPRSETDCPAMRLAWPLDPERESQEDPILAELLRWAITVVRVRLADPERHRAELLEEWRRFSQETLLFVRCPVALEFREGERLIGYRRRDLGNGLAEVAEEGESPSLRRYFLAERSVIIEDPFAREDATELHYRNPARLCWAMPLSGPSLAGRLWAWFRTDSESHVGGQLHGPWKLNNDRTAVVPGPWNSLLMKEAGQMVAEHAAAFAEVLAAEKGDPGRLVDLLPRQLDARDERTEPLRDALWRSFAERGCLPAADGSWRRPAELWRPPEEVVKLQDADKIVETWIELARGIQSELLKTFVHPRSLTRERAARLQELSEKLDASEEVRGLPRLRNMALVEWIEALKTAETERLRLVLEWLSEWIGDLPSSSQSKIRSEARLLPADDGSFVAPGQAVFAESPILDRVPVAADLLEDPKIRELALGLGAVAPNEGWWLERLLREIAFSNDLARAWALVCAAPREVAERFLREHGGQVPMRWPDGQVVPPALVLLPPPGSYPDEEISAVGPDPDTYARDHPLLALLPLQRSLGTEGSIEYPFRDSRLDALFRRDFADWLEMAREALRARSGYRPQKTHIEPLEGGVPLALHWLPRVTGRARVELTRLLLEHAAKPGDRFWTVKVGHATRRHDYPPTELLSPVAWMLWKEGRVELGRRDVSLASVVSGFDALEEVFRRCPSLSAPDWRPLVAELRGFLAQAQPHFEGSAEGEAVLWDALAEHVENSGIVVFPAQPWDTIARRLGYVPAELPWQGERIPLEKVRVSEQAPLVRALQAAGLPALALGEEALDLYLERGAMAAESGWTVSGEILAAPSPSLWLREWPELADLVKPEALRSVRIRRPLWLEDGQATLAPPVFGRGGELELAEGFAEQGRREQQVLDLAYALAGAGVLAVPLDEARQKIGLASTVTARRRRVAEQPDLAARLLAAVNGDRRALEGALPESVRDLAELGELDDRRFADLLLTLLGPSVLRRLRESMAQQGLEPPLRWGTEEARRFVAELGFPAAFAARSRERAPSEERFLALPPLAKLHDFQREVIEGLSDLQRQGRGRRRAVVSLPTGAGKTRAVAEGAVQLVLAPDARPDGRPPLVLWVAQAEELCEQAIETFRAVWAHRGRADRPLRVLRLWGGHPSPSPRDAADPTLVVATIQTLAMRRELEALAWLRRPALVVIDECHHSVAPSYTELLRFVGAAVGSERRAEEPMLVGLSATPFRADDEESRRLSARYDRRVLPPPERQASLPQQLVARGVLARAELNAVEVPFRADWPEQERFLELLEMYERLGRAAEGSGQEGETAADRERIGIELEQLLEGGNQCLALDERRNRMLIERIREHRARSVLLFANSLEHAERLAARLTLAGIPAAAVHGETDRGTRRYHIERFRAGELRVLCNYQLLSVGFDAPQVELVVISRLVFSRVRYMQMVGRGLRGPKNGGTERCEVLTLIDNIGRFPSLHPWHYAKEYFDRIGAG